MADVIEIKGLTKDYGQGRGIYDVSFSVKKGECFGFLGPNGAGKSTTIRHLMGFSLPQKGATLINGKQTQKYRDVLFTKVGYLPGEVALPLALTGAEFISEQKALKGVTDTTLLDWLIKTFEFDPTLLCKEMSLGMKRKLAIIVAFMADPDILIMDEPSSGLDPLMQDVFIELIKNEKKRGKTMLMSSHIFREIDTCCDRIAVIKDGKIVSIFNSDDLKHNTRKVYKVGFASTKDLAAFKKKKSQYYAVADEDPKTKTAIVNVEDKHINKLIKGLSAGKVKDFTQIKETLENYFMSFYKEDKAYGGI